MTMIEQVARAICFRRSGWHDDCKWGCSGSAATGCLGPLDAYSVELARAAIEAMREPTENIINAGDDAWGSIPNAEGVFITMIDAALSEPQA